MGGEVYLGEPTYTQAWTIGRQLGLQIAAHILSPFGIRPILDDLAAGTGGIGNNIGLGPDNLFIHMTGMSDVGWQKVKDAGAQVSIAFPIEMNMRHGMPPILKMQSLGIEPSLSSDVETQHDGGLLHPDALRHDHAAHGREPDDPRAGKLRNSAESVADAGRPARRRCSTCATCCATPPSTARSTCGSTARPARSRPARRPTSSSSTPRTSTWRRSTTCRARSCR